MKHAMNQYLIIILLLLPIFSVQASTEYFEPNSKNEVKETIQFFNTGSEGLAKKEVKQKKSPHPSTNERHFSFNNAVTHIYISPVLYRKLICVYLL